MLEFGFTEERTEVKDSASKREDQAQAGALFIPWVKLPDPGCLATSRPTSSGQTIRPLLKELGQMPDLFSKSSANSPKEPKAGPKRRNTAQPKGS